MPEEPSSVLTSEELECCVVGCLKACGGQAQLSQLSAVERWAREAKLIATLWRMCQAGRILVYATRAGEIAFQDGEEH